MNGSTQNNETNVKIKNFFKLSVIVFAITAVIVLSCVFSTPFAKVYISTVSYAIRFLLALVTMLFPLSIAELFVLLLPIFLIVCIIISVVQYKRNKLRPLRCFQLWIGVILCFLSLFLNSFGVCYLNEPIGENMGLDRTSLNDDQLYADAVYTRNMLLDVLQDVEFREDGSSINPYSYGKTDELINKGYDILHKSGVFEGYIPGKSKPILLSEPMTYTHISGMYFPFTGEANVNINYPDYVVAFTIAHEKAHQRGVAREDEANFIAFLALMSSNDSYLRYSALMNMYDYYLEETFNKNRPLYEKLVLETDRIILGEMYSYYKFFQKYSDSAVSHVADTVNDTFLKTMGEKDGVKSYGLVIELYHAYIQKENAM